MAVAGLYRRALPSPPAIEFASAAGKRLFSEALQSGTMEGFFKLISYFQTQSEPAYCGLASLSMVLNALGIDPGRKWKGPWRWFDETMLDCCEPLEKVKAEGITFGKVVCLAHCAGAKVEAFRTNESTIDDFRNHVIGCTSTEECHLNVSYNRKAFMQTGTGHFSPIGGYHATSDMVLILDVARFKYPPHWVPLSLLWEAMDTIDEATGRPRGFMLISRLQKAPSILYTLNCRTESWVRTVKHLIDDAPRLLKSEDINSIPKVLSTLLEPTLPNIGDIITWVAEIRRGGEDGSNISNDEKGRNGAKEMVLEQVHQTELFKFAMEWISLVNSCCGNGSSSMDKDSLPEIATNVCRQGAELLTGSHTGSKEFICTATCIRCIGAKGDIPMTVLSGSVVSGINRQEVDMMVPMSKAKSTSFCSDPTACVGMHPGSNDLLTVLLLALPSNTWSGIKDEKLLAEIKGLVSTDNLPDVLQEEVLHLRRQMESLKRCKFNDAD